MGLLGDVKVLFFLFLPSGVLFFARVFAERVKSYYMCVVSVFSLFFSVSFVLYSFLRGFSHYVSE